MISWQAKTVSFVFRGELRARGVCRSLQGNPPELPSLKAKRLGIIGNHAAHREAVISEASGGHEK
jgi:hypothetical protein